ncbi:PLDc N-terminal domain-containing protein [Corynebacterium afermentans]|uniref:PLDc N-terminal domain-containing protein n=1 Tax=Corynebacterium afermentans TaxID=38286 RepID=UPI0025745DEE|nr:PLDc N-terminal domain-containing protein [Corynebacterium afermentans]MCG7273229.1 PLDc N-terminal domain-containing protein [Corynebacterium afermentans]MCG7291860.1 PLDc N-terminal domain-containing protein [Corynebacterium afermentans]
MARNKEIIDTIRDAWNGLSSDQKTLAGVLATIDTAGKAFALRDLARTDSKRVRGPKWLWTPVIGAVNTLGWVAWFAVGKKR